MDYDYALAFALANKALCFFAGAGVSKHLTANAMPDWQTLLEEAASSLKVASQVKDQPESTGNRVIILVSTNKHGL